MATIHREHGFSFHVWPNDHEPPHVHVYKAGTHAVVTISDEPEIRKVKKMTDQDVLEAARIVAANVEKLLQGWRRLHGEEDTDQ